MWHITRTILGGLGDFTFYHNNHTTSNRHYRDHVFVVWGHNSTGMLWAVSFQEPVVKVHILQIFIMALLIVYYLRSISLNIPILQDTSAFIMRILRAWLGIVSFHFLPILVHLIGSAIPHRALFYSLKIPCWLLLENLGCNGDHRIYALYRFCCNPPSLL